MILDINKQRVDSDLVELFEIEIEGTIVRFTTYHETVKFYERDSPFTIQEYIPLPIAFSGYEQKSEGAYSRPTITFANIFSTFRTAIAVSNDDLVGKKLTRRKTLAKHLATGTIGASGSAPIEMPRQVFFMDRIEREDVQSITFELTSGFDLQGVTVPNRYILANTCTWLYQGVERLSLGGCTWNVANNNPTFEVRFDNNDRPILSGSFTTAMPGTSSSVTANNIYRTSFTANKVLGGTATRYNYFQALVSFTKTATFETANFRRCRIIDEVWNPATLYDTYKESKFYNPVVTYGGKVWVATSPSTGITPGTDEFFWERIDICGKKLSSCANRFKAVAISVTGGTVPHVSDSNQAITLPYGGFPGARRFNR